MANMEAINIPEFIATVAEQLKEANIRANERIRATQDDPFLGLTAVELQIAFTAEKSKRTEGKLELKPWIVSAGGSRDKTEKDAIVHTVKLNLTPVIVKPSEVASSASTAEDSSRAASSHVAAEGLGGHVAGDGLGLEEFRGILVYEPMK